MRLLTILCLGLSMISLGCKSQSANLDSGVASEAVDCPKAEYDPPAVPSWSPDTLPSPFSDVQPNAAAWFASEGRILDGKFVDPWEWEQSGGAITLHPGVQAIGNGTDYLNTLSNYPDKMPILFVVTGNHGYDNDGFDVRYAPEKELGFSGHNATGDCKRAKLGHVTLHRLGERVYFGGTIHNEDGKLVVTNDSGRFHKFPDDKGDRPTVCSVYYVAKRIRETPGALPAGSDLTIRWFDWANKPKDAKWSYSSAEGAREVPFTAFSASECGFRP